MNQVTDLRTALASAVAIPANPITRKDLLQTIAKAFARQGDKDFRALPEVEYHAENVIRAYEAVVGNVLHPIVAVLNNANVPTEHNLGSVMDNLALKREEVHTALCVCRGAIVSGAVMAKRFYELAAKA